MSIASQDRLKILALLSPAYLWLTVAIFLPLSAMLFFSVLSDVPFGDSEWHVTSANYQAFFETTTYATLLWKSVRLG
ncbi:MAG: ABC transporter permease, partial [Pseudomonadota bacterium]